MTRPHMGKYYTSLGTLKCSRYKKKKKKILPAGLHYCTFASSVMLEPGAPKTETSYSGSR